MSDMKKLAKYKAKFANVYNNPKKQQLYLSKIKEYSSKLKYTGQFGGGGDELEELQTKFQSLHDKVKIDGVMTKANEIVNRSTRAKEQHDELVGKFVNEIKRLHGEKNVALETLKQEHDLLIRDLRRQIEEKEIEIERLKKRISDGPTVDIVHDIEERLKVVILERDTLKEDVDRLTRELIDLQRKYDDYKHTTEEQIIALGKKLDELTEESEAIKEKMAEIQPVEADIINADVKFPQIMYDIAMDEFVTAIKLIAVDVPLPEATYQITEIVTRLKESRKDNNVIKREIKAKLVDNTRNGLVDKYIV